MAALNVVVTPDFWALPEPWTAVSWSVMRRRSGLRSACSGESDPGPAPRAGGARRPLRQVASGTRRAMAQAKAAISRAMATTT